MKKLFIYNSILIIATTFLAGCSHLYPVQAGPSPKTQCISMRREILFLNANSHNQDNFQVQRNKELLAQEYQQQGCNQIMQIEKDAPKKK